MPDDGTTQKKCPECGQLSPATKAVCFGCGHDFVTDELAQTASPSSTSKMPANGSPPSGIMTIAKPLLIALVVLVGVVALFWQTIYQRLTRDKADAGIERIVTDHLSQQKGRLLWAVHADNGVCRILFTTPVALPGADEFAANVAVRYSNLRQEAGRDSRVSVELLNLNVKVVVEAENGRVISTGMQLRDRPASTSAPTKPTSGSGLGGQHIVLIVWLLLCAFAVVLWRMVR